MTGGGTGGHLAIVRAVKEALIGSREEGAGDREQVVSNREQGAGSREALVYVGSAKGQDLAWFGSDGDFEAKYFFETRGVVNQGLLGKIKSLMMMGRATLKAIGILRKHHAKVVFSVGGFSAAPMAFAAVLTRTPLVIHEQNAAIGTLNRVLKPYANYFISSYDPESPVKAYPVKEIFFENARIRERVQTVIFLGGSQGAQAINRLALAIAPELKKRGIRIIHQAGERNIDEAKQAYERLGIEAEVFGFSDRIASLMREADFAVARAGASTLWELSATALPTLFIPYPYAAGDHQYYNAKFLVEKELAWMMREETLDPDRVLALIQEDMRSKSEALMASIEKDGSRQIAALLREI